MSLWIIKVHMSLWNIKEHRSLWNKMYTGFLEIYKYPGVFEI